MKKPVFVAAVIVVLVLSGLATAPQIKAASKTIVVPDDYPLIQDAIDSAADGDTIFVRSGVYYETLVIDKSLTLIGEDREHTVIDAHKITKDVVHITENGVTFTNFTLGHTGYVYSSGSTEPSGIHLEASYNHITNNIIVSVHGPAFKIGWNPAQKNVISNNIIINCSFLSLLDANNTIVDNTYSQGDGQISTLFPEGSNVIERNEEVDYSSVPSPFPADISLLEGDDILEVSRTKGASFGDLVLRDNAVLIVDNFEAKAQSLQATDNSSIVLTNGAYLYVHKLSGATPMRIYLVDGASLESTDSSTVRVVCRNSSQVQARNSTLDIEASGNTLVNLDNCTGRVCAGDKANITITNSTVTLYSISDEAYAWVSNSLIHGDTDFLTAAGKSTVWLINSTAKYSGGIYDHMLFQDESHVWIINTTICIANMDFCNRSSVWAINSNITALHEATNMRFHSAEAKLIYSWYLSVNVKSPEGAPLANMTVEVYYSNGTLVDEGITDSNGNAQFILAQHIKQKDRDQYFVPYTIRAYNANLKGEANVELDSNKEIIVTTSTYTPPQPIPATWIAATAIIVIVISIGPLVYFKKRKHAK